MKKLLALVLAALLVLSAATCGLAAPDSGVKTVVTSFYPVWILALNLAEGVDGLEVVNLTEPVTGCLHDYTLTTSDKVALSKADALLINGSGMESFLPVVTRDYPDLPVVDATEGLPFLRESEVVEIGEAEEGEEVNAHLWLDPQRAAGMASNLAEGLVRLLPDQAERISENLAGYIGRLNALSETLRDASSGLRDRGVIIFHEAFPYFAEACGLSVAAVVNKEPDDDLSAAQLARLVELVRSSETLPLVLKSIEPDPAVNALRTEVSVPVCELDPMITGPENPPLDYYETVMAGNLKTLLEAFSLR